MTALDATQDLAAAMRAIGMQARQAAALLARAPAERKTAALESAAAAIRAERAAILDANARDLADAGRQSLSAAMLDRLKLDDKRVEAMDQGLDDVAALPDPVAAVPRRCAAASPLPGCPRTPCRSCRRATAPRSA